MNEVVFLFFVTMTFQLVFTFVFVTSLLPLCKKTWWWPNVDVITAVMSTFLGKNIHNCDGRVNLVFHSFSNIQCEHFKCYFIHWPGSWLLSRVAVSVKHRHTLLTWVKRILHAADYPIRTTSTSSASSQRKDPYRTGWQLVIFYWWYHLREIRIEL